MKISSDILSHRLSAKHDFIVIGIQTEKLSLERPRFLNSGQTVRDNQIYIADSGTLKDCPAKKVSSVLMCAGNPPQSCYDCFDAVMIFDGGISVLELHNDVQDVFAVYEEWDGELMNIVQSSMGIRAMLDCSQDRVFVNPITLHDRNLSTITSSSLFDEEPYSKRLIKGDIHDLMATFKINTEYSETYTTQEATIFSSKFTESRSLYFNLFYQGKYQYRLLVIESERDFLPSDGALLEHLARYVRIAIDNVMENEINGQLTLPHVLKSILTGEYSDPYYVGQRLAEFGWNSGNRFVCIKILLHQMDIKNNTINLFCLHIEDIVKGACAFNYYNDIVALINLEQFDGEIQDAIGILIYFLRDSNLKTGVSNDFTDCSEITLAFKQAEIALNVGMRHKAHLWVHWFKDNVELLLLESCISELPAKMVCSPEILTLIEYDREHDTEYAMTLHCYLKNNLKSVKTAKELYIHRSTFLYRLERIRELTGLDLESGAKQWYLLLSFELLFGL